MGAGDGVAHRPHPGVEVRALPVHAPVDGVDAVGRRAARCSPARPPRGRSRRPARRTRPGRRPARRRSAGARARITAAARAAARGRSAGGSARCSPGRWGAARPPAPARPAPPAGSALLPAAADELEGPPVLGVHLGVGGEVGPVGVAVQAHLQPHPARQPGPHVVAAGQARVDPQRRGPAPRPGQQRPPAGGLRRLRPPASRRGGPPPPGPPPRTTVSPGARQGPRRGTSTSTSMRAPLPPAPPAPLLALPSGQRQPSPGRHREAAARAT